MTENQATYQAESTNWRDDLSELQHNQVELARFYSTHTIDAEVLNRSKMWKLVDNLAELLDTCGNDAPVPQPVLKFHVLDVPYHSQHEADAKRFRKDCGPTCVEMVGEYLCLDPDRLQRRDVTTDEIMRWIVGFGAGRDRSVWIKELQDAMLHFYGVTLIRHDALDWAGLRMYVVEDKRPAIVLVHYGSFATRMDRNYTFGHYLVVVGFDEIQYQSETIERVIVHDPDYYAGLEAQGAFVPIIKEHFMRMWGDCHKDRNPNYMALIPVKGA